LIEFAFKKVPTSLKVSTNSRKILLKRLATKVLPTEFDQYRKQGFSVPLATWLKKGSFRDLFFDVLLSSDCIFNKAAILNIFKNQDRGYSNGERIFSLAMFEIWRKSYGAKI